MVLRNILVVMINFLHLCLAALQFGFGSSNETWTDYNGLGTYQSGVTASVENGNSGFQIGAGLGADYWVTNSFYMGMNLDRGYGVDNYKVDEGTEQTIAGQNQSWSAESSVQDMETLMFNTGFRVGFILKII